MVRSWFQGVLGNIRKTEKLKKQTERGTKEIWGRGNDTNQAFDFGEREQCDLFLGTREHVPPTPTPGERPHNSMNTGLRKIQTPEKIDKQFKQTCLF